MFSCLSIVYNNYSFYLGQVIVKIRSKHMQSGKVDENMFSTKINPSDKMKNGKQPAYCVYIVKIKSSFIF